eukprot:scaffold67349_cov69-Phaeocystis_antarctica.AAC.1
MRAGVVVQRGLGVEGRELDTDEMILAVRTSGWRQPVGPAHALDRVELLGLGIGDSASVELCVDRRPRLLDVVELLVQLGALLLLLLLGEAAVDEGLAC